MKPFSTHNSCQSVAVALETSAQTQLSTGNQRFYFSSTTYTISAGSLPKPKPSGGFYIKSALTCLQT
jgi:hypothetical protein